MEIHFQPEAEQCQTSYVSEVAYVAYRQDHGGYPETSGSPVEFQTLPASFLEALDDFENGRVVDLDTALGEPPPRDWAINSRL